MTAASARKKSLTFQDSRKEKSMIIEKIEINAFGALTNVTLEFTETVNVISGENEVGKSTIAAFIRYMLYGFSGTEDGESLTERRKRINWNTGTAQGSMTVLVKGKRYLIKRTTVPMQDAAGKDAYKEECSIIDLETGASSFGKQPAGEVFLSVSGELYDNTAFVGQLMDSAIDEGEVKGSIEAILFSERDRSTNEEAVRRITEKMEELRHRSGQGGVIAEIERRRDELAAQLARSDEDNKRILAKETELYTIREERREAEVRLEKLRDLDDCYKNVMIIQTFDQLHELEEESAAKANAYAEFVKENTRAGYIPTDGYLTDIALARRAVEDTHRALIDAEATYSRERAAVGITSEIESAIELSDTLGGEQKIMSGATASRFSIIKNIALAIVAALALIAAAVYEIVAAGAFGDVVPRVLVGALGVAALAAGVIFVYHIMREKKALETVISKFGVESYEDLLGKLTLIAENRAKRDGMIRSTENARLAVEKARTDFDAANTELTRVIVRWGEEPPASGKGIDEFLDKLAAKVSAFLERKNILLEEKNTIELTVKEIRRTLSDKNEIDIRALVHPIKRKALANYNHDQITRGILDLKERIADCEREAFSVESELVSLRAKAGDPAALRTKIGELDARIKELSARYEAYRVAREAIEAGRDNLRSRISPRLGEYATELIGVMTDKKYTDFAVSKGLKITFRDEGGVERSVDYLSGGTRDMAYIAVRMALIDMLYSDKPPVCFDETFAHQDDSRAAAMMRALARLAEDGYQSFVFTCHKRECDLAKELVKGAGVFKLELSK